MKRRAELRAPRGIRHFHAEPISAAKLADQFCDAMIDNLRHNVGEQKKRFAGNF
jgi:hypothetical protein